MSRTCLASLAGAALLAAGCAPYERSHETSESRSVELAGAESARVEVNLGAGELWVEGGSARLLDGDFHYSLHAWRPEIKYDVSAGRGYLTVRQPPVHGFHTGNQQNRWDLHLNDRIPIELRANLGAGKGTFKLSGTDLRRLDVEIGAGELQIDLTGGWDHDFDAEIRGGVGEATVRLPHDVGVRIKATGGLGGINAQGLRHENGYYVNDAYGKSDVHLRLTVTGGIGQINLIG
jgi:N-terminal domain of toast_rack, DUF2154